jgi:hypothetical protein
VPTWPFSRISLVGGFFSILKRKTWLPLAKIPSGRDKCILLEFEAVSQQFRLRELGRE